MAPIVHGLEREWGQQVDFLYLDIADTGNTAIKARFGFRATPHFFLLAPDGSVQRTWQGLVDSDTLTAALQRITPAR